MVIVLDQIREQLVRIANALEKNISYPNNIPIPQKKLEDERFLIMSIGCKDWNNRGYFYATGLMTRRKGKWTISSELTSGFKVDSQTSADCLGIINQLRRSDIMSCASNGIYLISNNPDIEAFFTKSFAFSGEVIDYDKLQLIQDEIQARYIKKENLVKHINLTKISEYQEYEDLKSLRDFLYAKIDFFNQSSKG